MLTIYEKPLDCSNGNDKSYQQKRHYYHMLGTGKCQHLVSATEDL